MNYSAQSMRAAGMWLGCLLLSAGCTVHGVDGEPPPPLEVPDAYTQVAAGDAAATPDRWWEIFEDPELNRLVDEALTDNFDLRIAWARLDQLAAVSDAAQSGWWPQISAGGSMSRSKSQFQFGSFENDQFDLSLTVSYEIDLWGKVLSNSRAADLDFAASQMDLRTAAMTVTASVVNTWISLTEQRSLEKLIREQIATNEQYLALTEARFEQGLGSAVAVLQQREQVQRAATQLPLVVSRTKVLEHALAGALGRTPGTVAASAPHELPSVPPPPDAGLPADLLTQRPDVRAAQYRVIAADHRIAAAMAEYLPTISLSANLGFRAFDIAELFESFIWSLAASFNQFVWDGGRRMAEVERTEAVVRERLLSFGSAFLSAVREVEDAAVQERQQRAYVTEIDKRLAIARGVLDESRKRYVAGLSDYLPVLTALGSVQQIEQERISAERQVLTFRVDLYRALGGSWTDAIERNQEDAADAAGATGTEVEMNSRAQPSVATRSGGPVNALEALP